MTAVDLAPARLPLPTLRHEPLFAATAVTLALLTLPLGLALGLDGRTIGGELIWVKPLKFLVALSIYFATLAWFATWLPDGMRRSLWYRLFATVVVAATAAEMVWIGGAAAFGTTSHFNVATPMMGTIYGVMGILAVTLTSASLVYGVAIWSNRAAPLPPAVRLALGLGLVSTFGLTLVVAGWMAGSTSHLVGIPATGAAVPFVGWSREVGDLRVGHFFATHALHAVPLAGLALAALLPDRIARGGVVVAALAYAALTLGVTARAWSGQPFV